MENEVSITPVFDRHKTKKHLKPVELYLYKKKAIRNFIRIDLKTLAWDKKRSRPKNSTDALKMDDAIKRITMYCSHMDKQGQLYTKQDIENYLKGEKPLDIYDFYQFYNSRVLKDESLKDNTRLSKKSLLKWLKPFAPTLNIYELDYSFIMKFRSYLYNQKILKESYSGTFEKEPQPLKINYIGTLEKHLKATINIAIKEGLLLKNPYSKTKMPKERTRKDFLSKAELDILERMLDNIEPEYFPHLEKFLFGCYTGLRVSDLRQLKNSDFRKEPEGWTIYLHRMYKVDREVFLPLYSLFGGRAEKIVLSRLDEMHNKDSYFFKYSTDQNYNRNLKNIQAKSGIEGKKFASHLARHTFGTNLAKETGNMFTVMKFMGINKPETAMIYINMAQSSNPDDLKHSFKGW